MEADSIIKLNGYRALLKELGPVEAEKFISLIQQDPFDYTEWQKKLWIDIPVEDISTKAAEFRRLNKNK